MELLFPVILGLLAGGYMVAKVQASNLIRAVLAVFAAIGTILLVTGFQNWEALLALLTLQTLGYAIICVLVVFAILATAPFSFGVLLVLAMLPFVWWFNRAATVSPDPVQGTAIGGFVSNCQAALVDPGPWEPADFSFIGAVSQFGYHGVLHIDGRPVVTKAWQRTHTDPASELTVTQTADPLVFSIAPDNETTPAKVRIQCESVWNAAGRMVNFVRAIGETPSTADMTMEEAQDAINNDDRKY